MNHSVLSSSLLALALAALPVAAQTASTAKTTQHTSATTTHHTATAHAAGCATHPPEISSKIPALAAGAPCVKTLYTLTKIPTSKLDYVSPLVSPDVRESLGSETETYSLDYVDTEVGTGPAAKPHMFYTVKYTGYLEKDGTKFDSSDDHPNKEPITFSYGGHRVIPGWDTGFEGMHVGGKRRIFIPWELAYGEGGRPPVIPAKANLVFDIELVSQSDAPPPPPQGMRPGARPGMPGGAIHPAPPPSGNPPAAPSKGTTVPPAGNPPTGGTSSQPQSNTPPAGNPPTGSSSTNPQSH